MFVLQDSTGAVTATFAVPQADIAGVVEVTDDDAVLVAALAAFEANTAAKRFAALQARLKGLVDSAAEVLRLKLITPGSGQAMEYQEAYAEAVQVDAVVKANTSATFDPAAFPMLAASIGYDRDPQTGELTTDIAGEARSVLAAFDAYQQAGAAIRGARLKGKAAIDAATTPDAAQAAYDAIVWPKLG